MSAEIVTEYLYNAFCQDCCEGGGDGTEEAAVAWIEQHNAEYHQPDKDQP